ncbi:Hypothetical protein R9X50_00141400 [Acrodontium crateriforme]|uniref:Cupin type-1 domain-containing protein n=1 Tax=Acrodontium crateriforme TaxID=150365 RepID=A0AAQ3M543_9PEZI|nr:Hypothetical protein R9X50_00141400 [Acrodontium crateriforme]
MPTSSNPEVYWTPPSVYAPNSLLPVLVYRNVVPADQGQDAIQKLIEANHWEKRGVWGHIAHAHYHSLTAECYAPISGSTKCLYGASKYDDESQGVRFEMKVGDIAVHPAGVAHCNLESTEDYRYFGLYPEGSSKADSVYTRLEGPQFAAKVNNARTCPIPEWDPIEGKNGPLPRIWREAAAKAAASDCAI